MNDPVDSQLDNRGLQPPVPMVRTLEAYGQLTPGGRLTIHNDRIPVFLFPRLLELGATYEVEEQADGSAMVLISKPEM
jgi:TusA-related sulfurtransferase